jgi:hypothetical protein
MNANQPLPDFMLLSLVDMRATFESEIQAEFLMRYAV